MARTYSGPRVFLIHAGEDKDSFVYPLFNTLVQQGLHCNDIFLDEVSISPGDVIRHRILSTLSSETLELVVIVVSRWFLNKPYWPKLEFETCLSNNKIIFPIWLDANDDNFNTFSKLVGNYSPTLRQISARRVQSYNALYELPNIAAEIIQQLSTSKSNLSCSPYISRNNVASAPMTTQPSVQINNYHVTYQLPNVAAIEPPLAEIDESINCSPYIDDSDIGSFLRNYHDLLTETRRKLLQQTMTRVTGESRWVWRDAQITVHAPLMKVVFFSGDKTNKFVVHLNGQNCPVDEVVEKGWRLWFRDGFMSFWSWISGAKSITAPSPNLAIDK